MPTPLLLLPALDRLVPSISAALGSGRGISLDGFSNPDCDDRFDPDCVTGPRWRSLRTALLEASEETQLVRRDADAVVITLDRAVALEVGGDHREVLGHLDRAVAPS